MSALPPPPPSSPPPDPAPPPAPKAPAPASTPASAEPPALMPYDDLFGVEERAPEQAPNLTFNVAAAPPPPAPPRPAAGPARPPAPVDVPGVVVGDDRPAWIPPLPADEPPDPILKSPVVPAPPTAPFVQPPPPPAAPRSISELMETVGKAAKPEEDVRPPEPQMWTATAAQTGKAAPLPKPPPAPRPPPPPTLPLQPQAPVRTQTFDKIAPAPVRVPPPSAAEHRA